MIFNAIVILMVLGLGYAWMVRGFFNAFMHLLCVLVAGAIAFAAWEPLAYFLVKVSPERGILSFVASAAWGIALIVPFAVALLLTRLITDKIVKGNVKNAAAVDYAGGAVCGLVSGVICAGVFTIGVQGLRLSTSLGGYRPLWYTTDRGAGAGSLVLNNGLLLPVDRLTGWLYSGMSKGSMSSGEPLAKWYPSVQAAGFAARISPDGAGSNTIRPQDFRLLSTYSIGTADSAKPATDLLTYEGSSNPQKYLDIHGDPVTKGYLAGYVVEFDAGAKERGKRGGQVMVSNGQVTVLAQNAKGDTTMIFPVAMISESGDASGQLGRWRFDADDTWISSVGGGSKVTMGFEFIVPEGYTPLALNVRQTRLLLNGNTKAFELKDTAERDRRVRSKSIFNAGTGEKGTSKKQRNESKAVVVNSEDRESGFIAGNALGEVVPSQTARSRMSLGDQNEIADGEAKFLQEEIGRGKVPSGKELRVDKFAVGPTQAMVRVDVSGGMPASLLSDAARIAPTDQPILLIDSEGREYEAVGFTFADRDIFQIRYTPGTVLAGVGDTPPISSARDDQKLVLLFVVTKGARIEQMAIGDIVIANLRPALPADK